MSTKYKLLLSIILIGIIGVGCFYLGKGQKEVVTEEKIVYKEGKERIVEKEIIREKIIRPDGTIEERIIEKDKDTDRRDKEIDRDSSTKVTPILSNYSLGIKYWPSVDSQILKYDHRNIEITAGYRVWGEAWVDVGYKLDNSVSLGLSFKF